MAIKRSCGLPPTKEADHGRMPQRQAGRLARNLKHRREKVKLIPGLGGTPCERFGERLVSHSHGVSRLRPNMSRKSLRPFSFRLAARHGQREAAVIEDLL